MLKLPALTKRSYCYLMFLYKFNVHFQRISENVIQVYLYSVFKIQIIQYYKQEASL